jgi:hypothetical protein
MKEGVGSLIIEALHKFGRSGRVQFVEDSIEELIQVLCVSAKREFLFVSG